MYFKYVTAFLTGIFLFFLPVRADAARIVVLSFDGPGPAAQARLSLVSELMKIDGLTLVPHSDYTEQAEAAGVAGSQLATSSGVIRGAAVAAVDGVIAGRTQRRGNRWAVALQYFDSEGNRRVNRVYRLAGGSFLANDLERIVRFVTARVSEAGVSSVPVSGSISSGNNLSDAGQTPREPAASTPWGETEQPTPSSQQSLAGAGESASIPSFPLPEQSPPPAGDAAPPPAPDDFSQPAWGAAAPSFSPPSEAPAKDFERGRRDRDSGRNSREGPGSRDFGGPDWAFSDERDAGLRERAYDGTVFSLSILGGGANRDYVMKANDSANDMSFQTSAMGDIPLPLFPEVGVLVEGFPFRGMGTIVEGVGMEVVFTRGFVTSSFSSSGETIPIDTPVTRLHSDVRWLLRIMPASPFSPRLGLRFGFGYADFSAKIHNPAFTGVSHTGFRVGIDAIQPLVPGYLNLNFYAVALPVAMPGEDEREAFGHNGQASGWAGRIGFSGAASRSGTGPYWVGWIGRQYTNSILEGVGSRDTGGESREFYTIVHGGIGWAF